MKAIFTLLTFLPAFIFAQENPVPAAWKTGDYLPLLRNRSVALVANQTSLIEKRHLADSLLMLGINLKKIFCPEHGFRGNAEAGQKIKNETDPVTQLPVISLYGKKFAPDSADLNGIDILVFDIQDVGVRFYTFISTLHYVMQSCAIYNVPLIVLDRPNPNGNYIDGPVLDSSFRSFVGMHPVPVVYGMTIGEFALMIAGEKWLNTSKNCSLTVIACNNYNHSSHYNLPVKPSPNLPNMRAVYLYPSLCLFEGTTMSVGRGTPWPFQVIGHPSFPVKTFWFIPENIAGVAEKPLYEKRKCYGIDLRTNDTTFFSTNKQINIALFISVYEQMGRIPDFFNSFFDKLAGTDQLRKQIIGGKSESEIKQSWEKELNRFKQIRQKYLLYPDFE